LCLARHRIFVDRLNNALAGAGLPASFWTPPRGGGYPGIWSVDLWGAALSKAAQSSDHFDLVACRGPTKCPQQAMTSSRHAPAASTTGEVMHLWIFWTPCRPSASSLRRLSTTRSPRRSYRPRSSQPRLVHRRDHRLDDRELPTWLWINASAWRTVTATAAGGGLVATVWATPTNVTWRSDWDFPDPRDDPEGGITLSPESLNLVCSGPGASYRASLSPAAQSTACESVFTQSTFGTYQPLGRRSPGRSTGRCPTNRAS